MVTNTMGTPWGLPAELLQLAKTQTDPIHGDIYWTQLETELIDSEPMQRLRHVRQLGMTLKVYPSAEHSRFTHLLGTVAAAQKILDKIEDNCHRPHSVPSLLTEWEDQGSDLLALRWKEATVLARLSALLHDLTHVPFGHTIEDDLEVLTPHDKNQARFDALWVRLPDGARAAIEGGTSQGGFEGRQTSLYAELRDIVLDKVKAGEVAQAERNGTPLPQSPYPFVADVVNNTICADLLDYIARDHYFLGLPFAIGDRFMDNFYIVPSYAKTKYKERLVVRLTRDGEARRDVRTELLKYLRYRYEETERALYHKTKLAYDAMLGKMLEMWKDSLWYDRVREATPEVEDDPRSLDASWLRGQVRESKGLPGTLLEADLDAAVRDEVEQYFTFFGDEGLIEHLIWEFQHREELDDRERGVLDLARRIRYRDHYRLLGQASGAGVLGVAAEKFSAHSSPEARRELEIGAARFAGVTPAWNIILWIPSPSMRLKIAEVLVEEDDQLIRPLARSLPAEQDGASGDRDAALIVERHMQLWALRIFGPSTLRDKKEKTHLVLAYLQRELGLPLLTWDGRPVPSIARQVAIKLGDERQWSEQRRKGVEDMVEQRAARDEFPTFKALLAQFRAELV